jgi:hypothetical protein
MPIKINNFLLAGLTAALVAAVSAFSLFKPSQSAVKLEIPKLFSSINSRGANYAKTTLELRGQTVRLIGFAAVDPNIPDRFVLTRSRKTLCSPCDESADYPSSITVIFPNATTEAVPVATDSVFVRLAGGQKTPQTGEKISVIGKLELNQSTDEITRFSSLVQLSDARLSTNLAQ